MQSELVANETMEYAGDDPRAAAVLESPLVLEENVSTKDGMAIMIHSTRASHLRVAAAMRHEIDGPEGTRVVTEGFGDVGRVTIATRLKPGQKLRMVKFFSYGWSAKRSRPAMHDQVVAALAAAQLVGWEGLRADQREYLDEFWAAPTWRSRATPKYSRPSASDCSTCCSRPRGWRIAPFPVRG
ncbi:hypothetical protein ACFQX6_48595 [Streptosporangium lutulentum]